MPEKRVYLPTYHLICNSQAFAYHTHTHTPAHNNLPYKPSLALTGFVVCILCTLALPQCHRCHLVTMCCCCGYCCCLPLHDYTLQPQIVAVVVVVVCHRAGSYFAIGIAMSFCFWFLQLVVVVISVVLVIVLVICTMLYFCECYGSFCLLDLDLESLFCSFCRQLHAPERVINTFLSYIVSMYICISI